MRRILLLITDLEIGGTPTVVRELAVRLHSCGVAVEVACLAGWGPVADQIASADIPVAALGARNAADVAVIPRLVRLIRDRSFDTVFSFLIHANAAAAASSFGTGAVRYIQAIQTTQFYPRWHWRVQHLIHVIADAIVVPSESVARAAEQWAFIPREKTRIIPNAVEPADFAHLDRPLAVARPFPVGFVGRLDPIKRVPDLIEAVQRLRGLVHLHIFGEGSQRADLEALITARRIEHLVSVHSAVARPQDALSHIGLLVLPSAAEGFGLVLIEAMAARIPVIGTNVAGIRDVIVPGQSGLLVPPGDSEALADAIAAIVNDQALRDRLIYGGYQRVVQRFSWRCVFPEYLCLLRISGCERCS